jgi:hypothetical protein
MMKRIILAVMFVVAATGFPASAYAQKVDEVTLTVSGDGATKTEATEVALRSAIEQAFGVFVSANTTILDDELVKDEIATVSSGNIKKYEEITSVQLPNGNTSVTLQAVVSVSKLITYAQSKGTTAEFAGATFGMNMRLKELNKSNEEKAIANMVTQLKALAPSMFDFKLTVGEPKLSRYNASLYEMDAIVDVICNNNTEIANSLLLKTLSSLSLPATEVKEYESLNMPYYTFFLGNSKFRLPNHNFMNSDTTRNVVDYAASYNDYVSKVRDSREQQGREISDDDWKRINDISYDHVEIGTSSFILRSSESVNLLIDYINYDIRGAIKNFKITDNMGNISTLIHKSKIEEEKEEEEEKKNYDKSDEPKKNGIGTGIISSFAQDYRGKVPYSSALSYDFYDRHINKFEGVIHYLFKEYMYKHKDYCYRIRLVFEIPKEDISKYSSFTISNKKQ